MKVATEHGKAAALAALAFRRAECRDIQLPDNVSLPAGSPMFFRCIGCGCAIVVPEGYVSKPDACAECTALVKLGWME